MGTTPYPTIVSRRFGHTPIWIYQQDTEPLTMREFPKLTPTSTIELLHMQIRKPGLWLGVDRVLRNLARNMPKYDAWCYGKRLALAKSKGQVIKRERFKVTFDEEGRVI